MGEFYDMLGLNKAMQGVYRKPSIIIQMHTFVNNNNIIIIIFLILLWLSTIGLGIVAHERE